MVENKAEDLADGRRGRQSQWTRTMLLRAAVPLDTPISQQSLKQAGAGERSESMTALFPHLFRLLRYGSVGIAVALLYSGLVVAAMDLLGFRSPTLASCIAFLIVLPVSFYAHRRVSFHDAAPDIRQSQRFALIAITSFIVAVGAMKLVTVWKLHYTVGIAFAWVVIPITNFAISSIWVFPLRQPREKEISNRSAMDLSE